MTTATLKARADHYPTRMTTPIEIPRRDPVIWPGTPTGPLTGEALRGFEQNGFLSIPSLITPSEVAAHLEEIERLSADPTVRADERVVVEPDSQQVRSIFEVHKISETVARLANDPRLVDMARQILGSEVYIHQSRINFKPGFGGNGFYWHSDFETWHAEDGMPSMRAFSVSIALTENYVHNGGLMIMPGSHRTFVGCAGETPEDHYKESLRSQEIGTPDPEAITRLAARHGIQLFTGPAGSATVFDCNCMHGSNGNITPYPRSNIFLVYNSVENTLEEPFAAPAPRPSFIAAREFTPVGR